MLGLTDLLLTTNDLVERIEGTNTHFWETNDCIDYLEGQPVSNENV
jgi:hypothetical protein